MPSPIGKGSGQRGRDQSPRLAIEAPSPCVDGGRFPARRIVGSLVQVECDIIADGHDKLAAALRWRGPGETEWTETPMRLLGNDRWAGGLPLNRLGITHYTIEAWKDVWATFVDELTKKHEAGVPTALEVQGGRGAGRRRRGPLEAEAAGGADRRPARQDGRGGAARRSARAGDRGADGPRPTTGRSASPSRRAIPLQAERTAAGFASWYEVFPRSMSDDPTRHGTFRDVVRHLPRIQAMGFDVLYFPPIHPIGRKNRKGRNNTLTPGRRRSGQPVCDRLGGGRA